MPETKNTDKKVFGTKNATPLTLPKTSCSQPKNSASVVAKMTKSRSIDKKDSQNDLRDSYQTFASSVFNLDDADEIEEVFVAAARVSNYCN